MSNTPARKPQAQKKKTSKQTPISKMAPKIFLFAVIIAICGFAAIACKLLSDKNPPVDTDASTTSQVDISSEGPVTDTTLPTASDIQDSTKAAPITTAAPEPQATAAPTSPPATAPITASAGLPEPQIISVPESGWELTMVNTNHRLPDGYKPELTQLVSGNECTLDYRVAPHYIEMYNAALAEGVTLTPYSGYRSYETQSRNYNNKIKYYVNQGYSQSDAEVKAATIIMPPGSSEHNLGFAMDIVTCDNWFETTKEFEWLTEHAADYGFIMRYSEEKYDITKVIYEPWHWRYVGVEAAQAMKASGQCLEEYLGIY